MARNFVMQMSCNEELRKSIENHQKEKKLNTIAEAGRDLIELALRILNNAKEDEGPTTRDILIEILKVSQYNSSTTNVVHGQTFDMLHLQKSKVLAGDLRIKLKEDAESKVKFFLQGKGG